MSQTEFRTFVFRITNAEAAQSTLEPLMAAFSGRASLPGIEVTGASLYDEMSIVDLRDEAELLVEMPAKMAGSFLEGIGGADRMTPISDAVLATPGLAEALQLADHASPMPAQAQAALQTLRRAFANHLNCSPEELLAAAAAHQIQSEGAGDDRHADDNQPRFP